MFDDSWLSGHANLAGLRLVDVKRVGMPVYSAQLDVLTEERRELPLVSEYCLRLVAAGVVEQSSVAGLLGISASVSSAALADLIRVGAVRGDEENLSITDYGKEVLDEYGEIVCNEAVWFVPFDSMLGKPHPWRREQLLTARELLERGHGIEVFPFSTKPVWNDFKPLEVWQCLSSLRSDKVLARLVSIREVRRAPLRFVAAVAAGYRGDKGETHVVFFVDGRPLEDHSRQFAERGGLKRPMFKGLGNALSPSAVQLRAAAGRRLQLEKAGLSGALSLQLVDEAELDLSPHMLGGMLLRCVNGAKREIALSSTTASPLASKKLVDELVNAAARNVRIRIALQKASDGGPQPLEAVAALGHANGDIKVTLEDNLPVTHLLIDDSLAVVGSDDWLAANLCADRTLGQRWRVGTTRPDAVRAERERLDWARA